MYYNFKFIIIKGQCTTILPNHISSTEINIILTKFEVIILCVSDVEKQVI